MLRDIAALHQFCSKYDLKDLTGNYADGVGNVMRTAVLKETAKQNSWGLNIWEYHINTSSIVMAVVKLLS